MGNIYDNIDDILDFLKQSADSPAVDAFGKKRISEAFTIFDSKQTNDNQPLFWDDQEISGTGTSSTYNTNKASTTIGVSANTAGKRVRQTFQRFNYQPGKAQDIFITATSWHTTPGITKRMGYFSTNNGVFFESSGGVLNVGVRSYVTGSPVDTLIPQTSWSEDKMDGKGKSGVTLDPSKFNIYYINFGWLGGDDPEFGIVVGRKRHPIHRIKVSNVGSSVFISTPNLPVRYEIENDGSGAASTFDHICSSVQSEGGQQNLGILRHADCNVVSSLQADTKYALLGIRLKSTHLDKGILIENLSLLATTVNDQAHWELIFNPTVAGTFTYTDVANSGVQIATGAIGNTVTGGYEIDGGYLTTSLPVAPTIPNALRLGSKIDGTPDTFVLAVRPITNNISATASLTWRELS